MCGFSMESRKRVIRESIVEWFNENGREFPWRFTTDPYYVLVAEMLLRRTTATAVSRIYPAFMKRFNQPERLAKARIATIASTIGPLGLQNIRAQHLKETALNIVSKYNGTIPNDLEKLTSLPGVGMYVAAAVLNFAYHCPVPLVDGNVIHLMSRAFGLKFNGTTDQMAWDFMSSFNLGNQNRAFYWGIIDLVAMVCNRKYPRCKNCPIQAECTWYNKISD
jgi:A/G-specific adenine glycosylase